MSETRPRRAGRPGSASRGRAAAIPGGGARGAGIRGAMALPGAGTGTMPAAMAAAVLMTSFAIGPATLAAAGPAPPGAAALAAATAAPPDAAALLRAADAARHPIDEGIIHVRATVEGPGRPESASSLEVYVKGGDRTLCEFTTGDLAGRKVLAAGGRVWLLVPGVSRAVPVSAGQRLLGGASIADVARLSLAGEYRGVVRAARETVGGEACLVIDLEATSRRSSYARGVLWVGAADRLPRRARFSLPSGKEAKEIRYEGYGREGDATVLRRMVVEHLLPSERGQVTTLEFTRYERRAVDDARFEPNARAER